MNIYDKFNDRHIVKEANPSVNPVFQKTVNAVNPGVGSGLRGIGSGAQSGWEGLMSLLTGGGGAAAATGATAGAAAPAAAAATGGGGLLGLLGSGLGHLGSAVGTAAPFGLAALAGIPMYRLGKYLTGDKKISPAEMLKREENAKIIAALNKTGGLRDGLKRVLPLGLAGLGTYGAMNLLSAVPGLAAPALLGGAAFGARKMYKKYAPQVSRSMTNFANRFRSPVNAALRGVPHQLVRDLIQQQRGTFTGAQTPQLTELGGLDQNLLMKEYQRRLKDKAFGGAVK